MLEMQHFYSRCVPKNGKSKQDTHICLYIRLGIYCYMQKPRNSSVIQQTFFNHKHILYLYIMDGLTSVLNKISIPSFLLFAYGFLFSSSICVNQRFFPVKSKGYPYPSTYSKCILHWNPEKDMNKKKSFLQDGFFLPNTVLGPRWPCFFPNQLVMFVFSNSFLDVEITAKSGP